MMKGKKKIEYEKEKYEWDSRTFVLFLVYTYILLNLYLL